MRLRAVESGARQDLAGGVNAPGEALAYGDKVRRKAVFAEQEQSGYVVTPMAESIAQQSNPDDPESVLTEMAKAIPMRRLARPEEVGELAAFLGSDESSYITGSQFVIDGGSTLPESVSVGV